MEPLVDDGASGRLRGATGRGAARCSAPCPTRPRPSAPLRFQPARPAPAWVGERDATRRGAIAPQNPSDLRHFMGDFDRRRRARTA